MGCFLTCTAKDLEQIERQLHQESEDDVNLAAIALVWENFISSTNTRFGKAGEQVAAQVLEQTHGLHDYQITQAKGIDIQGKFAGNQRVVVEVKTRNDDTNFANRLDPSSYGGHRQCSDEWLQAVGVNPDEVSVWGVHINPNRETVSIYSRRDSEAKEWDIVRRDIPWSDFVSS